MKSLFSAAALLAIIAVATPALARQNPAVQPIFFEHLESSLPQSEPSAVKQDGFVTEVTLSGLAWAVDNVKNDPVPLVIEFYSSDPSDCATDAQTGNNECLDQAPETVLAASVFQQRVRFLRIDVKAYPILLNGPDVRVLPSHIVVQSYSDTTHYTAIKVGGYLSQSGLQSLIQDTLAIDP